MKIIVLIFGFVFGLNSFAQDAFYEKIKKQPVKNQMKIIEKRIQFFMKKGDLKGVQKNTKFYFDIPSEGKNKLDFVLSEVRILESKSARYAAAEVVISLCSHEFLLENIESFSFLKGGRVYTNLEEMAANHLTWLHMEYVFKNPNFYKVALTNLAIKDKKVRLNIFGKAAEFGFYSVLKKLYKHYKHELELNYFWCRYLADVGENKKSRECFGKKTDTWSLLRLLFVDYTEGMSKQPSFREKYKKIKKQITSSGSVDSYVLIYEILFFGEISYNEKGLLYKKKSFDDYNQGYLLLSLNQKKPFLSAKESSVLLEKYYKKFPNKLFSRILDGSESIQRLKKRLGKNSIYVLVRG